MDFFRRVVRELGTQFRVPRHGILIALGAAFFAAGAVGFFIPLVPGIILWLPGLFVLSLFSPTLFRQIMRLTADYPKLQARIARTYAWAIRKIREKK